MVVATANGDWPLHDVVTWLMKEGRHLGPLDRFVSLLGERLVEAGAPIWRMYIVVPTLHPQHLANGVSWMRGGKAQAISRDHGVRQTDSYIGSPVQHVLETGTPLRRRLDRLDLERDHAVLHEVAAKGGKDYVALPIMFSDGGRVGVMFATDCETGFSDQDIVRLETLGDFLAPVLEVFARHDIARSLLDTYLGPRTGKRVLSGQIKRGDGEVIHAAIWFSDLRDFTPLTETLSAEIMLDTLNAYFELVAAAVTARGGEILRFIGDAMLIVFPTASEQSVAHACDNALDAALDACASMATLNHRRRRNDLPPIRFGVGLHEGEVVYGNVGAPNRLDFTVMGPAVNRSARIEGLTKELDTFLLMSREFVAHVGRAVRSRGTHPLKGVAEPQEVFALVDDD